MHPLMEQELLEESVLLVELHHLLLQKKYLHIRLGLQQALHTLEPLEPPLPLGLVQHLQCRGLLQLTHLTTTDT